MKSISKKLLEMFQLLGGLDHTEPKGREAPLDAEGLRLLGLVQVFFSGEVITSLHMAGNGWVNG